MATTTCPACNKPIDPTRAPVARVRGGRVLTFCSQVCADAPQAAAPSHAGTAAQARGPAGVVDAPATTGSAGDAPGEADERRHAPAARRPRGNGKRRVIALSALILVGGMVITIINAVSPSTPVDVRAESPGSAAAGAAETAPAAPAATAEEPATARTDVPADPYEHAQSTLRALLQSPSMRVQQIAAMALARLGTAEAPAAVELLAKLIEQEDSELGRIELAYALARAGDRRGRQLLVSALVHERRDIRLEAARSLVQLGDDAGTKVLERMMDLSTHRLSVAALLARRGSKEGLAALREVMADSESGNELTMRAVVALGRAGDASVRDRLVEILEDGRYHVGAADALAALGDHAAVPALTRQLGLSSLRVRAALGLRRLDQSVPLDALAAALEQGNEAARVSAAEAILILAGPRNLAELD